MNEILVILLVFVAGLFFGTIFFGGLWWTVKKGVQSKRPALWFVSSFIIRMVVTVLGFYFVSDKHFERILICLLGFLVARFVITRLTKTETKQIQ
jgi:F1F0 ATPase subunit 2